MDRPTDIVASLPPAVEGLTEDFSEFHLFPKFPIELRHKIWKDSILERVVEIESIVCCIRGAIRYSFASPTPVPAILHTSAESRQLGLEVYELAFGNEGDFINKGSHTTYFNFKLDIVKLSGPSIPTGHGSELQVRRYALAQLVNSLPTMTGRVWGRIRRLGKSMREPIAPEIFILFPKLEEVIFLAPAAEVEPPSNVTNYYVVPSTTGSNTDQQPLTGELEPPNNVTDNNVVPSTTVPNTDQHSHPGAVATSLPDNTQSSSGLSKYRIPASIKDDVHLATGVASKLHAIISSVYKRANKERTENGEEELAVPKISHGSLHNSVLD